MGNGSSNCAFVSLEGDSFHPGDSVKGTLYLLITNAVTVDSVMIVARAFESVRWKESVPDQRAIEHNRILREITN